MILESRVLVNLARTVREETDGILPQGNATAAYFTTSPVKTESSFRSKLLSKVFVLDTNKQPLNPVHPGRARLLLTQGKAAVWRRYPFTIILKKVVDEPEVTPLRVKLDPGSKTTGIAIVDDESGEVVFAAELQHRGSAIKKAHDDRRAVRRSRRQRKTRYRKPRFAYRKRPKGWLPPSQISRITNVLTWVRRLQKFCPITTLSMELVRFDMQLMQNPNISGVEYKQCTLYGYEHRDYFIA